MLPSLALRAELLLDQRRPRRGHATSRRPAGPAGNLPRVAGYHLLRKVGEGRMATVYLAQDIDGAEVALKMLRRAHTGHEARAAAFAREFGIPAAIHSRHVVRVYEQLAVDGDSAVTMEFLGAGHLGNRIVRGLAPETALSLLRQAALALDAMHRHGFAHGDIKPANLMLRANGELVLVDFGLARRLDEDAPQAQPALVVGTPRYAAPEQSRVGGATPAADVYSLGILLYEMLCGKPPFPGHTVLEVVSQHLMAPVPRLRGALAAFQPILDAMLAKQAGSRLQDGQDVLRQIDLLQDAAVPRPAPVGASETECQR